MYEFYNKPGTLLARALRGPRTKTYISHIVGSSLGRKLHTSSDMATEFRSFYEGLYNLDCSPTPNPPPVGVATPQSYLASSLSCSPGGIGGVYHGCGTRGGLGPF